jgi:hypothetical protein
MFSPMQARIGSLWLVLTGFGLLVGCGPSPCDRVCTKLNSCHALTVSESQCATDCSHPPNGARTCTNEDAIASCFEQASCDDLTNESSRLRCPTCQ